MKNGVLGVVIVVVSLMMTTGAGYILNVNQQQVLGTNYNYITDINGLFEHTNSPQFADYNPPTNYTGYTNYVRDTNSPTGIRYTTTEMQSPYIIQTDPSKEINTSITTLQILNDSYLKGKYSKWQSEDDGRGRIAYASDEDFNSQIDVGTSYVGNTGFIWSYNQGYDDDWWYGIKQYDYITLMDFVNLAVEKFKNMLPDIDEKRYDFMTITLDATYNDPNTEGRNKTPFIFRYDESRMSSVDALGTGAWIGTDHSNLSVMRTDYCSNGKVTITVDVQTRSFRLNGEPLKEADQYRLVYGVCGALHQRFSRNPLTETAYNSYRSTADFTMWETNISMSLLYGAQSKYVDPSRGYYLDKEAAGDTRQSVFNQVQRYTNDDIQALPTTRLDLSSTHYIEGKIIDTYSTLPNNDLAEIRITGPNVPSTSTTVPYMLVAETNEGNSYPIYTDDILYLPNITQLYFMFSGVWVRDSTTIQVGTTDYSPYDVEVQCWKWTSGVAGYTGSTWDNGFDVAKLGMIISTPWYPDTNTFATNTSLHNWFDIQLGTSGEKGIRFELYRTILNQSSIRVGYVDDGDWSNVKTPVPNHALGKWDKFYIEVDTIDKTLYVYSITSFTDFIQYQYNSSPIYKVDLSSWGSLWSEDKHYCTYVNLFADGTLSWYWQISRTNVWLNDYGAMMVDPTLKVKDYFVDYDDYRIWIQSTAVYGDSIELNGVNYPVDKNSISITETIGQSTITKTHQLNNYYITVENDEMFLTFVDDNKTYNLGTISNEEIKFIGYWYFKTALYQGVTGLVDVMTWTWDMAFDFQQFIVIALGIAAIMYCYYYRRMNMKSYDTLIVLFSAIFGIALLITTV